MGSEGRLLHPDLLGVAFDSVGELGDPFFADDPFLRQKIPYAINDSGTIAGNFPDAPPGSVASGPDRRALVMGLGGGASVLPPGNPGDVATSINSSNVIGGQSGGKPVLWVPNP